MNKKDCEHLGYLLATCRPISHDLCEKIFDMDDRIELEYDLFQEVQGESDEIDELTEELLIKYNSNTWFLTEPGALKKTYAECLDEARRQVLGDEYDPSVFRR